MYSFRMVGMLELASKWLVLLSNDLVEMVLAVVGVSRMVIPVSGDSNLSILLDISLNMFSKSLNLVVVLVLISTTMSCVALMSLMRPSLTPRMVFKSFSLLSSICFLSSALSFLSSGKVFYKVGS